jgi:hypothetical protein
MSTLVAMVHCTSHQDDKPSLGVYSDGHGYCFGCGTYFPDFAEPQPEKEYANANVADRDGNIRPDVLPWSLAQAYQELLYGPFRGRLDYLYQRGLWDSTVRRFMLGHSGRGFSIPNWNPAGELLSVKFRRDDTLEDEACPKYWGIRGYNQVSLYPAWRELKNKTVLLCEGELDVIRLTQCLSEYSEFVPLTMTGGAAHANMEVMIPLREARKVYVLYDQDEAGQKGARKVRDLLDWSTPIIYWDPKKGKDVTDFLNHHGSKALFACLPSS